MSHIQMFEIPINLHLLARYMQFEEIETITVGQALIYKLMSRFSLIINR